MSRTRLKLTPASPAVGAYVEDVDLGRPLVPEIVESLKRAHADYGVLFFRDQTLTPVTHIAISGLSAVHSSRHVFGPMAGRPADLADRLGNPDQSNQVAVHPVVLTHPRSGRRALYVNPGFTIRFDGWTAAESEPLLSYLYQHATRPEFACRFQWQPGSLAFWDNRCTWHRAVNDCHGERRLLHRITLEGEPLMDHAGISGEAASGG